MHVEDALIVRSNDRVLTNIPIVVVRTTTQIELPLAHGRLLSFLLGSPCRHTQTKLAFSSEQRQIKQKLIAITFFTATHRIVALPISTTSVFAATASVNIKWYCLIRLIIIKILVSNSILRHGITLEDGSTT